ncbi:hypothetical protein K505DRAFT_19216 [Melanomma pulvis-pyrius CBS 109.77]|uniref:Uncharacterized protein n=1 Tax=Melanomma pulvis-pyrius CBS 109.77 TaxID=1314802 RepID=A0A6A6XFR4_9PLEO|nr:hypothetical protein K505DRAFT_19216 [Melanomma pulvis-pyrius CBS 109.77]
MHIRPSTHCNRFHSIVSPILLGIHPQPILSTKRRRRSPPLPNQLPNPGFPTIHPSIHLRDHPWRKEIRLHPIPSIHAVQPSIQIPRSRPKANKADEEKRWSPAGVLKRAGYLKGYKSCSAVPAP